MLWPEIQAIVADYPEVTAYLDRLKGRTAAKKVNVFSYSD
jgi:glutathione S-transferase